MLDTPLASNVETCCFTVSARCCCNLAVVSINDLTADPDHWQSFSKTSAVGLSVRFLSFVSGRMLPMLNPALETLAQPSALPLDKGLRGFNCPLPRFPQQSRFVLPSG